MTAQQFQNLSLLTQKQVLQTFGILLLEQETPEAILHLYLVKGFYVEVQKYLWTSKIIGMRAFEQETDLDQWLSCIDLSGLDKFLGYPL